jgi:hypothetical protein
MALAGAQNNAARKSPFHGGTADQQVQSGDKGRYRAGAGSNPDILASKVVSGLTSPLTAGDKKRSPSPKFWRQRIH